MLQCTAPAGLNVHAKWLDRRCGTSGAQAARAVAQCRPTHFITASARLAPWSKACWKGEAPYIIEYLQGSHHSCHV